MKILWLTNCILPQLARMVGKPEAYGGGWLTSLFDDLLSDPNHALTVLYPTTGECPAGRAGKLRHAAFPMAQLGYHPDTEALFSRVLEEEKPEVIHIWGTEYAHTLEMVNACEKAGLLCRTVIHIQGLCSRIAEHFLDGLPEGAARRQSLRDVLRRDGLAAQQEKLAMRGENEIRALKKACHVIGRTDWDYVETEKINPKRIYHKCCETLRPAFYTRRWTMESCRQHALFAVAGWPIKGMHHAIDALKALLPDYPDATLSFAGEDVSAVPWYRRSAYQKLLIEKLSQGGVGERVRFLGMLDEEAICKRYCRSHVFLSPSAIENSPNSVGEAMLLGVPVVASDVGGTRNLLTDGRDGVLYPYERPEGLIDGIRRIFEDDHLARAFSESAHAHAAQTHNREENLRTLLDIYASLCGGGTC